MHMMLICALTYKYVTNALHPFQTFELSNNHYALVQSCSLKETPRVEHQRHKAMLQLVLLMLFLIVLLENEKQTFIVCL